MQYPIEEFDLGLTFSPRANPIHAFTGDRAFFTSAEYPGSRSRMCSSWGS
jgi:hypothetical protein